MDVLSAIEHRPYLLPAGQWRMAQRWNDLLFAHWPIAVEAMARLIPAGLEVDSFDGWAWVGVVPFWMDRVRTRALGQRCVTVPSTGEFCELNLRTYVRSRVTGLRGVYFFRSMQRVRLLLPVRGRCFICHIFRQACSERFRQMGRSNTEAEG